MQSLKLFSTILISACLLFVYLGNTTENAVQDAGSNSSGKTIFSKDEASFSCILDGKKFSSTGTDENINAAFRLKGEDEGQIFFKLMDMKDPVTRKLNFQIPGKVGRFIITNTAHFSYIGLVINGYVQYLDDSLTININSITSARVAGTFFGRYTLSEGSGDSKAKKIIEVKDGKFDIPFSTSADWKKLYNAE